MGISMILVLIMMLLQLIMYWMFKGIYLMKKNEIV